MMEMQNRPWWFCEMDIKLHWLFSGDCESLWIKNGLASTADRALDHTQPAMALIQASVRCSPHPCKVAKTIFKSAGRRRDKKKSSRKEMWSKSGGGMGNLSNREHETREDWWRKGQGWRDCQNKIKMARNQSRRETNRLTAGKFRMERDKTKTERREEKEKMGPK